MLGSTKGNPGDTAKWMPVEKYNIENVNQDYRQAIRVLVETMGISFSL